MLDERVLAGDAQVGTAVLHVGRHVRGPYQNHANVRLIGGENELARLLRIFKHFDAGCSKQRQGFVKNSPFGQGQGDRGHVAHLMRSMSAPMARSLVSIWS